MAVGGGFAAGALLGAILQAESVVRSKLATVLVLLVVFPLLGTLLGTFASLGFAQLSYHAIASGEGPQTGALGAVVAIPGVALTMWAVRRADRARPGSVIHEIERRGAWTLPAAAIAIGAVVAGLGNPHIARPGAAAVSPASLALGVAATASLVITLFQEIAAMRFAGSVWATASELRPREADALENGAVPRVDLGIGEQELEHYRSPGVAYRSTGGVQLIVKGDPMLAHKLARRAAFRTALALALAVSATIGSLTLVSAAGGEQGQAAPSSR